MTLPVAVVTAIISLVTVIGGGFWGFRRNNISGAKEVTESALLLIKPQNDRITMLTASVDQMAESIKALQFQIVELETHITALSDQIVDLGHVPTTTYRRPRPIFPPIQSED